MLHISFNIQGLKILKRKKNLKKPWHDKKTYGIEFERALSVDSNDFFLNYLAIVLKSI